MSESHKILRIFIASPSGLDKEREALKEVVEDINRRNSTYWSLQFQVVGWEDTVGGNRRAQDIINRDLETCDYFFGILADHWGSRPHSIQGFTTPYTSGFEEEYELAQTLFDSGDMNDIHLFFGEIPSDKLRDIGPSLKKVLDFRDKVRDARKPLYVEFDTLETLKSKVGDVLSKIGWDTINPVSETNILAPGQRDNEDIAHSTVPTRDTESYFLSQRPREFLNEITARSAEYSAVSNVDVARLRLISATPHRSGNDVVHIGVHDANLLFRGRFEHDLSSKENTILLTTGLRHMENQNVPFWYLTGGDVVKTETHIQDAMTSLDEDVARAALTLSDIFGYYPTDLSPKVKRWYWIKKWFENKKEYRLHNAAERYLARWADEEGIPTLQQLREGKSGQQAAKLDCIIICIKLRASFTEGVEELYVRDPEYISPELNEIMRNEIQNLSSECLVQFAKLKAETLRLESIKELSRRKALTKELAEELSGDNSIDVRLAAIKALADRAIPISNTKAEKALVMEPNQSALGGLFSNPFYTKDRSRFEEYLRHLLENKPLKELLDLEKKDDPFDAEALLTACRNFHKRTGELLRSHIEDGFERRFETRTERMEGVPPLIGVVERTRDLKAFVCRGHTRRALDILAAQKKQRDLTLVRKVIDRGEMQASNVILEYLARFGSWDDVDRILNLKQKSKGGLVRLTTDFADKEKAIGEALYTVGKGRIVDLLEEVKAPPILAAVIKACARKVFNELNDDKMIQLMNVDDDTVRRVIVVKCLQVLPKSRIRRLFGRYMREEEYQYYNVVYWLDLGVTMPKSFVEKIIQNEMRAT